MSFSGMVKEELAKVLGTARHCKIAELSALLMAYGRMLPEEVLRFQTENDAVARKYFTLLQKAFNIGMAISVQDGGISRKNSIYTVDISKSDDIERVLQGTKLSPEREDGTLGMYNLLPVQNTCCKRAFIRGAFLASGSISNPEKFYHFEIVEPEEQKALQLQNMIRSFHIDAKIVLRKKSYVVYVKDGTQIVDMLAVMEASRSLMNLENIRIVKEVRNSVNRKVNCETANINKTVNAAVKQIADIELIRSKIGFQGLNEGLAQMAELRLQYPDASLKELGAMLSPQVGKSGVNHRLRKLSILAEELRMSETGNSGEKEELL